MSAQDYIERLFAGSIVPCDKAMVTFDRVLIHTPNGWIELKPTGVKDEAVRTSQAPHPENVPS